MYENRQPVRRTKMPKRISKTIGILKIGSKVNSCMQYFNPNVKNFPIYILWYRVQKLYLLSASGLGISTHWKASLFLHELAKAIGVFGWRLRSSCCGCCRSRCGLRCRIITFRTGRTFLQISQLKFYK